MNGDELIEQIALGLDPAARERFDDWERFSLRRSLEMCRMQNYPPVVGDPSGERCSGEMVCSRCGQPYAVHPMDWRMIGYGDRPFLNVLCSGERVKL